MLVFYVRYDTIIFEQIIFHEIQAGTEVELFKKKNTNTYIFLVLFTKFALNLIIFRGQWIDIFHCSNGQFRECPLLSTQYQSK